MSYDTPQQIARRQARQQAAQRRWDNLTPEDMDEPRRRPKLSRWAPYDDDDDYDPRGEIAWESQRDRLAERY